MERYSINADHVTWEMTEGEAVIIHFETSAYYGLNPAGAYVWNRLAEGCGEPGKLAEEVAARYGQVAGKIAADIDSFLARLKTEDLITTDAPSNGAPARAPQGVAPEGEYQPPRLTRFGELEKLILSGE